MQDVSTSCTTDVDSWLRDLGKFKTVLNGITAAIAKQTLSIRSRPPVWPRKVIAAADLMVGLRCNALLTSPLPSYWCASPITRVRGWPDMSPTYFCIFFACYTTRTGHGSSLCRTSLRMQEHLHPRELRNASAAFNGPCH